MTEIEFQDFLLGKRTIRDDLNYHWFNLSRDLHFFNYSYDNNRRVLLTHDVYNQLFDYYGELRINNFNRLVNLSNENFRKCYMSNFEGYDYWELIRKGSKQDMMKFLNVRIITPDVESYEITEKSCMIVAKDCFAEIQKLAELYHMYYGNTGTHIFAVEP